MIKSNARKEFRPPYHLDLGIMMKKIPAKAFLSYLQSSAVEGTDWGTVIIDIVCEYVVYGERERGRGW